jgi:hypothetical protein
MIKKAPLKENSWLNYQNCYAFSKYTVGFTNGIEYLAKD